MVDGAERCFADLDVDPPMLAEPHARNGVGWRTTAHGVHTLTA